MIARPALLALALTGCLGGAKPAPAPTAPVDSVGRDPDGVTVHRDGRCRGYHETVERAHAIAITNADARSRGMIEAGLTAASFDADTIAATGDEPVGWQVVDASERRVLLSPPTYQACGVGNPWALARRGGALYVLAIQAHVVARHELLVCGCEADVPIDCGGAAPAQVRWRWTLPRDVTFEGPLSLIVDDESSRRGFAGGTDGAACPFPTAPP